MNLRSIVELVSKKFDEIVELDSLSEKNLRAVKRFRSLEKGILSQGKDFTLRYQKLAESVISNEIVISEKAFNDSFKSRLNNNRELSPYYELLSDFDYYKEIVTLKNGFPLKNELLFEYDSDIDHFYPDFSYAEFVSSYMTLIREVESALKQKRILNLLINIKSLIGKRLNSLYLQIPIIASLLEFFDQVFTLKDYEIDYNDFHNSFNNNVETNNYCHGREIHGFIPITS